MEKQHKFSIWHVLLGVWVVLLVQNALSSYLAVKWTGRTRREERTS